MSSKLGRKVERPQYAADQLVPVMSMPVFGETHRQLWGLLSISRETANFHKRGAITLFWEDGVFKVVLNDRPNFRSAIVSHQQLGGALGLADAGMESGNLTWRKNRHQSNSAG